jgi:putative phosphoesterase
MARSRIGLISDTHGLLRPQALAFLQGCDQIIHGGDIGDPAILTALRAIAPLTVVRGNNDMQTWAAAVPLTAAIDADGLVIWVLHDVKESRKLGGPPPGTRVVVAGHSHRPSIREIDGVLHVNPGSAGRRRFSLPISLGELIVEGGRVFPRIVELAV